MERIRSALCTLILFSAGCNCGERTIEEEVEPDYQIEPLCEVHCSLLMECAYEYVGTVDFNDEAGCYRACVDDVVWGRTCADEKHASLQCQQQVQCPEFATHYTAPLDGSLCESEQRAYSACLPGEPR